MSDAAEDRALVDFLVRFLADRESGHVRSLRAYLAAYPGHEEAVARRYLELHDAPADDGDDRRVGPYRLLDELGRGAQGEVWRAEHEVLTRRVALKLLHPGRGLGDDARSRFRREAAVASRLDHPGLCAVYDSGRSRGRDWIAMRLVPGRSLAEILKEAGRLDAPRAILLVEALARALHAAHEAGVVHRDVKPANVMVDEDGSPVLLDFGLARDARSEATLTRTGSVFGTPDWMAPEQVRGARDLDRRTDVWALGCVLYEALAGRRPFAAATASGVLERIVGEEPSPLRAHGVRSADLEVVVATALEKDRGRRYQTALALAEDLRRVREHEPIRARRPSVTARVTRFVRRHPGRAAAIAGGLAAAVAIGWFAREAELARAGLVRTDDYRRAEELVAEEADALWPVDPSLVPRARRWLDEANDRIGRRETYANDLVRLDGADDRTAETIERLLDRLDRLRRRVPVVADRLARADSLFERSVRAHAAAWAECGAAIARSPLYGGLELAPQVGLVPLGVNADGAHEFWHVESGGRPPFVEGIGARLEPTSGIVLVLVPGGGATIGASPLEGELATTNSNEPARRVGLAPYFLSKYETTQGQWLLAMEGDRPSEYAAGDAAHGTGVIDWTHPVESISARAAERMLARVGLALPTEAQWEAACRAGARTPWSFGSDRTCSARHANLYGAEMVLPGNASRPSEARDPHPRHAPVGSYRANRFGLHDMHGNVFEWCRDVYVHRPDRFGPRDGIALDPEDGETRRVIKGGSFLRPAVYARCALRAPFGVDEAESDLGFRAARAVDAGGKGREIRTFSSHDG
ncbi:MAG: bifunctional serine/threonine-protein kinase/formylglycine-generating enzyme family protein [Planctomycetota bacterium JB042]